MLPRRIPFIAIALCTMLVSGCAPKVLKPRPESWPDPWKGRHLFNTPRAYIYASTPELAGEADRAAIEVAKDFEQTAKRPAPKALLIVSDVKDEPAYSDLKTLYMASARNSEMRKDGKVPTDAELEKQWNEAEQKIKETARKAGFTMGDAVSMVAISLNQDQILGILALPPDVAEQIGGAVLMPSSSQIRRSVNKAIFSVLNQQNVGPVAKIAIAPLMVAMMPKMVDMLALTRKTIVFEQMARQQADWSPEQVGTLSKAYSDGLLKPAMAALTAEAEAKTKAARAATQPASATRPVPDTQSATDMQLAISTTTRTQD